MKYMLLPLSILSGDRISLRHAALVSSDEKNAENFSVMEDHLFPGRLVTVDPIKRKPGILLIRPYYDFDRFPAIHDQLKTFRDIS